MLASEVWNSKTRFVEIGTRRRPLCQPLARAGFENYLCVVRNQRERERLATRYPEVAPRIAVAHQRNLARQNNAEVLLLGSRAATSALRFRNLRHAGFVVLTGRMTPGLLLALAFCVLHVLCGRLGRPRRVLLKATGKGPRLLLMPVRKRRQPSGARHYVPHSLGLSGFLTKLTDTGTRHVVLRWFEKLPGLPAGEDLDLLVADQHLPAVLDLLHSGPGVQPCDIYSETGLPRSDFRKMPYYPPRLAKQLLDGAVMHKHVCRVPQPDQHLLSLVYHALYHKGPASAIPETADDAAMLTKPAAGDHPYPRIIAELAKRLNTQLAVTRAGLEEFLERHDWRPPRDMLVRLGKRNRWVRQSIHGQQLEQPEDRGLAVFIVRQEALSRGGIEKLLPLLQESGFAILQTKQLTGEALEQVTRNVRGGNWGRGPWACSGGPPAAVVVAFDPNPLPLNRKQRKKFPLSTNARLLEKSRIRDAFNAEFPLDQHCNALHSSDNGAEAWEYIALAMPDKAEEIRRQMLAPVAAHHDASPVLKDLTRFGRRTRVELVMHQGRPAVRKTFKAGCERYCRREELALRELSSRIPQIPPLIEANELAVVYPFYDDVLRYERSSGWLMPVDIAQQAIEALRAIHAAGYALIDASVDNLLVDRQEGLKLIDFEFLHRYEHPPTSFEQSYDIAGCPADFSGDLPAGGCKNYRKHWQPYTGLTLDSLLNDPAWLQTVKRTVYVAVRPQRYFPRRLRYVFRRLRSLWQGKSLSTNRLTLAEPESPSRRAA